MKLKQKCTKMLEFHHNTSESTIDRIGECEYPRGIISTFERRYVISQNKDGLKTPREKVALNNKLQVIQFL